MGKAEGERQMQQQVGRVERKVMKGSSDISSVFICQRGLLRYSINTIAIVSGLDGHPGFISGKGIMLNRLTGGIYHHKNLYHLF